MKRRAATLVFARLSNYGVMLLSPLILVRLLSVDQFGEYREFMLYAGILQWIAGFSVNDSLLYFIPLRPERTRAWVRSSILLVAAVSGLLTAAVILADAASGGDLLGWFALPLAIYVLAFANFDFWEGWFLGAGRTTAVLIYSTVRLAVRMAAAVIAAVVWRDVHAIVWAVVATEVVRLVVSAGAWWLWDSKDRQRDILRAAREQWRFCLQTGLSRVTIMINRNLGAVLIARLVGPAALARFTVATYPEPAVSAISKSMFLVALPELVRRLRTEGGAALDVWKRTVSWTCAGLFLPLAYMVMCAEDLIRVGFGEEYVAAAPLLQAFVVVMVRNCVDFTAPLQAVGQTRPLFLSNALGLVINAIGLAVLMPRFGELGVAVAFAVSTLVEPLLLAPLVSRRYEQPLSRLLRWGELGRICAATLAAVVAIIAVRALELPAVPHLLVAGGLAAAAYLLTLVVLRSECIAAARQLLLSRLQEAR